MVIQFARSDDLLLLVAGRGLAGRYICKAVEEEDVVGL